MATAKTGPGLRETAEEAAGEGGLVEIFADKDEGVAAGLGTPGAGDVAAEELMDALKEVFFAHAANGEQALHAVEVVGVFREEVFDPGVDPVEVEVAVHLDGEGSDAAVVSMLVLEAFDAGGGDGAALTREAVRLSRGMRGGVVVGEEGDGPGFGEIEDEGVERFRQDEFAQFAFGAESGAGMGGRRGGSEKGVGFDKGFLPGFFGGIAQRQAGEGHGVGRSGR